MLVFRKILCTYLMDDPLKANVALNPFLANVFILYLLKAPEKQRFSCVFRRYKIRTWGRCQNGLRLRHYRFFLNIRKFTLKHLPAGST